MEIYDSIGHGYCELRQADPRIEAAIALALGHAKSVVNVGAGAGSYEPRDRKVVAELRRVARQKVVILTWDPSAPGFWLTDYFPEILEIDRRIFPTMDSLAKVLGPLVVTEVPIPSDCTDGFLGAYWRRPDAYLLAQVRSAISTFTMIGDLSSGLARLSEDLSSGAWEERNGALRQLEALDLGYRLVVASCSPIVSSTG